MQEKIYDVIVVGCGPAGNTLAYQLARKEKTVLMLEKKYLPRNKTCAGGISRKTLMEIPYSIDPVIERKIVGSYITNRGKVLIYRRLSGAGVMVNRDSFDHFMTTKAIDAGAELREMCHFLEYDLSDNHIKVHCNSRSYKCRVLVGADGAYSKVRKQLHPDRKVKYAIAIETKIYPGQKNIDLLNSNTMFDFAAISAGYGWIFPKKDHFNVGVYRAEKRSDNIDMKKSLLQFTSRNPVLCSDTKLELKSFPIPVRAVAPELAKNNVVLIGDAAGLGDGLYGEGIYYAVRSGKIAAETIQNYLAGKGALSDYNHKMLNMRRNLFFSRLMAKLFYLMPRFGFQCMIRSKMVNDFFAGVLTGRITPSRCFLYTVCTMPFWPWMTRYEPVTNSMFGKDRDNM